MQGTNIISIDWLTLYCQSPLIASCKRYVFEKRKVGGQQFKYIYDVYDTEENEKYAIVQTTPYSPIIPKNAVMVQICNRFLYRQNWNIVCQNFLMSCNITPISISRLDICCDFNTFKNGLHAKTLIKGLLTGKYRHVGRSKVTVEGRLERGINPSYLRVGNRESEISVYLYNKSLELKEVKDKPYIRQRWKENGLDTEADVWRLEVSLSNCQMRTVLQETGEMFRLDLDFFKTQGILENVYRCAIKKTFDIRIDNGKGRTNKMPKLELFKDFTTNLYMTIPTNEACTNRMDRILIKRLADCHAQYRVCDQEKYEIIYAALNVLLENEELRKYYNEKVVPSIGFYMER